MARILVACEKTQAVCIEFRKMGHEAFSCDLQDCTGGFPEWHIKDDVMNVLSEQWSAMVAFPVCTHLAVSGARHFEQKIKDGRQQQGIDFFMKLATAPIKFKAIENPVGIMSKLYRKPDQIIQPYYFGDEYSKKTCLWLTNLPKLFHSKKTDLFCDEVTHVGRGEFITFDSGKKMSAWYAQQWGKKESADTRSKTFSGIARAMAQQWSGIIK